MSHTPKGASTRERLSNAAFELFSERGYHATTMRDIADRAGRSPGLTYRYFARKEDFVVALYDRLADALTDLELPEGTVGVRYAAMLRAKIDLVRPSRRALGALAAAWVDPEHRLGVTSAATVGVRDKVRSVIRRVVCEVEPPAPERWVDALYAVHLLVVLLVVLESRPGAAEAAADLVGRLLDSVPSVLLSGIFAQADGVWSNLFAD